MRRSVGLFCILFVAGTVSAHAQSTPAATSRSISITAGGTASMFQPDFAGNWQPPSYQYPMAETSSTALFGVGAYVDVKFTRWIQIEAEGRWQRFNQNAGIYQDNYLAGPRVPIHRFWKASFYGKALGGFSNRSEERRVGK